uniref:Uncharacterized protein n=1 Tax=Oryctolagus cuniculus TaxID=9986 RepID=G1TFT9_RABIT
MHAPHHHSHTACTITPSHLSGTHMHNHTHTRAHGHAWPSTPTAAAWAPRTDLQQGLHSYLSRCTSLRAHGGQAGNCKAWPDALPLPTRLGSQAHRPTAARGCNDDTHPAPRVGGPRKGRDRKQTRAARGVSVAMEPSSAMEPRAAGSPDHGCLGATPAPPSERDELSSPSQSTWRSSVQSSAAGSEGAPGSSMARPRRVGPLALAPAPEPKPLRLRPASLRTQDISHLLAGVFRGLYSGEVIGEDLSASLIKGRGSENQRHEAFVEQLRQVARAHGAWGARGTWPLLWALRGGRAVTDRSAHSRGGARAQASPRAPGAGPAPQAAHPRVLEAALASALGCTSPALVSGR